MNVKRTPLSASRRPLMIVAAVLMVCLALAATSARPSQAITCGPGCVPESSGNHIYYTDATYKTILCITNCNGDTCDGQTSPYEKSLPICCCE